MVLDRFLFVISQERHRFKFSYVFPFSLPLYRNRIEMYSILSFCYTKLGALRYPCYTGRQLWCWTLSFHYSLRPAGGQPCHTSHTKSWRAASPSYWHRPKRSQTNANWQRIFWTPESFATAHLRNTFSFPDTITTGYPLLENYHLKMRQLVFLI